MNTAIVFGCGGVGKKCKHYLEQRDVKVIAFSDNDERKWGQCFDGIRIIPPAEILSLTCQQIAIGNYKAADSIKQQLLMMGVEKEKIIIPYVPNKVFRNDSIPAPKDPVQLNGEQEAELTRWYQGLGVKLTDDALLKKLADLKLVLHWYNIPVSEVCVVSGAVLQVLGLRTSKPFDDIDIIMSSPYRELYGKGLVIVSETCEMHPQNEYDVTDDEIIKSKGLHFLCKGLRFMDPLILYRQRARKPADEETILLGRFLSEHSR